MMSRLYKNRTENKKDKKDKKTIFFSSAQMDALSALRAEIAKKKKISQGKGKPNSERDGNLGKRWRTKAEIEREREAVYLATERAEAQKLAEKRKLKLGSNQKASEENNTKDSLSFESSAKRSKTDEGQELRKTRSSDAIAQRSDTPPLAKSEVCKRLRAMKEPISLFGESVWDRFDRLRNLELVREDGTEVQRNIFQTKLREMKAKEAEEELYHYAGAKMAHLDSRQGDEANTKDDSFNQDEEPTCKEDYVHMNIRKYLRLWKSEVDAISPEERKTMKGRSSIVTHEQTKEWLRPLERLLRKRKLSRNILDALKAIFESTEKREYVRANTLYLERLAIGNAPWPMGATMVGIHARAAREKIGEDKIAHVMNDEQTRKYIQAVKRLLTVAQRHFPTTHSKMIL